MQIKLFSTLATLLLTILLNVGIYGHAQNTSKSMPAKEFAEKLKSTPSSVLIDVRTLEEFKQGHLQNASNIDWYSNDFEKLILKIDKSKPVFIYCKSGGRSSSAVTKMLSLGFKEVIELNGGITKWQAAGLPIVK